MKTPGALLVAFTLATLVLAQPAPAPPETARPAPPLSATTLAKIAQMAPLFDGRTLDGWIQAPAAPLNWRVKDGAMASTGASRGVIYTQADYTHYRLIFTLRHVAGKPDHQPGVLIFCTRPLAGERGLDALGGIQLQAPNGGHWDYRPGKNNAGTAFTNPIKTRYDNHDWFQVEMLVNAADGTARMAVAIQPGTRAIENLVFRDSAAGRPGPIAWQMHNAGLFDEYKDVRIEIDPKEDRLITVE